MELQYVPVSASFDANFGQLVVVDSSGGNIAGTLPHPYGFQGQPVSVFNNGANSVSLTIRGSSATFSNGATTLIIPPLGTMTFTSNGGYTSSGVLIMQGASQGPGLRMAYAKYSFAVDGGAIGAITPAITSRIPDNAIIIGGTINSPTAVESLGSATLAVGTTAGSSATSILAATAKASLSADAVLNAVPVFATPVKMSATGSLNVTVGTAALTAGVVEVFVLFYVPSA